MIIRTLIALVMILPVWTVVDADDIDPVDVLKVIYDLESEIPSDQASAAIKLARIYEFIQDSEPELKLLLKSKDTRVQLAGVRALWAINGASKEHLPILINGLKDDDSENRDTSASLIESLGPEAVSAIPQLCKILKEDDDADVRIEAATALGSMGLAAKSAIPDLVAAFKDQGKSSSFPPQFGNYTVGMSARFALQEIGPEAIPAIVPFLENDQKNVRISAMWVLAGGKHESMPYIPFLIESLDHQDKEIQQSAIEILGELRIDPDKSIPALAKLLIDEDQGVRFWAVNSIGMFGVQAKIALPNLIAALKDEFSGVRARSADALGEIGPAAIDALPQLKLLLEDKDYFFFPHAVKDLVAPHAEKAITKIKGEKQSKESED